MSIVWHKITSSPKKEGQYLVRAPTPDPKVDFLQVGYWVKMNKKEKMAVPEAYRHGFYAKPEAWIPLLTHWASIPAVKDNKK